MKTKTMLAAIAMVALLVSTSVLTNAQTTPVPPSSGGGGGGSSLSDLPDQLPIGSVADLEAYAWEHPTYISMSSWASSSINATTNVKSSVWIPISRTNGVPNVDEIFGIIKAQQLLLAVLYPSDTITLGVNLYDKDYNNLFYSYSSAGINPPEDKVSKNVLDVVLNVNSSAFLRMSNVSWFYIVERDENNNPIRYWYPSEYEIQNGGIQFPFYFAGKLGEVIVTLNDGTQVAYSLNGGNKMSTLTVQLSVGNVSALGTRTFRGTNVIYIEVTREESEQGINPLCQFVNTEKGWNAFAAWRMDPDTGQVAEYASAVHIWLKGKPSSSTKPAEITDPARYVPVFLDSGSYWIKYIFKSGYGRNDHRFYPPYQGGGRG